MKSLICCRKLRVEDYEGAAIRHFVDAASLRKSGRRDNAGHLVGFAAECAIKHRISSLRRNPESPRGHFPELLAAARKRLGRRNDYTKCIKLKADVFADWNINRRYCPTGHTTDED